ncbi:MAG: KEOPS complex subunit Pcc1 [Candidatus Woesearchaeota archaeon]
MDYAAKLFAKGAPGRLLECLVPEETSFDRSSFTVTKKDDGVEFDITANDAVALRATLNSISQLLIVFEGAAKEEKK